MINEAPRPASPAASLSDADSGVVINYPTLSIKRRGYQLSHVINYPLDNLSNEPIMENRPNHVMAKPTTPPSPLYLSFVEIFYWSGVHSLAGGFP